MTSLIVPEVMKNDILNTYTLKNGGKNVFNRP